MHDFTNPFLTDEKTRELASTYGTPLYVWDEATIRRQVTKLRATPSAFGLDLRFAMKACPNRAIINLITSLGVGIDASSAYEVARAQKAGVPSENISLTAQELPNDLIPLLDAGVWINATSLSQLERLAAAASKIAPRRRNVGVRVNPGLGSGHCSRTNVGGPSSSFGIWWEYVEKVLQIASTHDVKITTLHSHIGSGADPSIWEKCARLTLECAAKMPDVTKVSLGGGMKVARIAGEIEVDLAATGERIANEFRRIEVETGRKFTLELEPGAFLMATAGSIISSIIDVVDTGKDGYRFIKLDTGMTEIVRPSLYGAQHPIAVVTSNSSTNSSAVRGKDKFVAVGHCCESGDILTPAPGDPDALSTRELTTPEIGDFLVIGSTGAYTSGMSTVNYNSFPQAAEVLLKNDGISRLVRRRQTLEQVLENEAV